MWTSKMPCSVTESMTFPVTVPVMAAAGAAGRARARIRATSVDATARRTSVEITWGSLLKGSPQRGGLVEITTDVRRSIRANWPWKVSKSVGNCTDIGVARLRTVVAEVDQPQRSGVRLRFGRPLSVPVNDGIDLVSDRGAEHDRVRHLQLRGAADVRYLDCDVEVERSDGQVRKATERCLRGDAFLE